MKARGFYLTKGIFVLCIIIGGSANKHILKMYIDVDKKTEFVAKGGSKFYGAPDVNADFEWPYIIDNGDEVDLEFICQLNCSELSEKCSFPLKNGMLYFFLDPLPEKWFPENKDSVRVLYSKAQTNDLDYIDSIDQNGESIGFHELKIIFESNVLRNTNKMMEIMNENDDIFTLIELNSDVLSLAGIELAADHYLEIFSKTSKIINCDFTDIRVRIK